MTHRGNHHHHYDIYSFKGIDMNADDIFELNVHNSYIKQFQNSQSSYCQNRDEAYHSDDD